MLAQRSTKNSQRTEIRFTSKALAALMLGSSTIAAFSNDNYQQNVLLNPSNSALVAEKRGRVVIYDGLKNEVVSKAMDDQFERIDNMMFLRVKHEQVNGEYMVEDDDCD